jgi:hypothetical protein
MSSGAFGRGVRRRFAISPGAGCPISPDSLTVRRCGRPQTQTRGDSTPTPSPNRHAPADSLPRSALTVKSYNAVLEGFPTSNKAPAAQLHKGLSLLAQNKRSPEARSLSFAAFTRDSHHSPASPDPLFSSAVCPVRNDRVSSAWMTRRGESKMHRNCSMFTNKLATPPPVLSSL